MIIAPQNSSVPKGLVGLRNIGNTCFMYPCLVISLFNCGRNSILQCLFNAPLFSDHFVRGNHLKEKNSKSKGVANAFGDLVEKVKRHTGSPSSSAESTYELKGRIGRCWLLHVAYVYLIGRVNSMFSGYDQHDAQEFLKTLLEAINDDLNRVVTKPAYKELTINHGKKLQETVEYCVNRAINL